MTDGQVLLSHPNAGKLRSDYEGFDIWTEDGTAEALMTKEETDIWMNAPWEEAQHLARPAPDDAIMITSHEPYGSTIISKEGEPVQASLL